MLSVTQTNVQGGNRSYDSHLFNDGYSKELVESTSCIFICIFICLRVCVCVGCWFLHILCTFLPGSHTMWSPAGHADCSLQSFEVRWHIAGMFDWGIHTCRRPWLTNFLICTQGTTTMTFSRDVNTHLFSHEKGSLVNEGKTRRITPPPPPPFRKWDPNS